MVDGGTRRLVLVRAGNLVVRADPSQVAPYRTSFGRWPPRVHEEGADVVVDYPRFLGARSRRDQGTMLLATLVPWRVVARGPLQGFTADLAAGTLRGLDAEAAARVTLTLPPASGRVAIRFTRGVNQVTIHRPLGVAAGLRVAAGSARLRFDDQVFKAIGGQTVLRTPGFEAATDRYEIEILGGAAGLTVDTMAPVRPAERAGRALATVLFTDIVGSTDRARALGDARWRELLDQHDAAARTSVEGRGGRVVKGTGDGILATFETPGSAIEAARAFRSAAGDLGVQIRAGVHTGEVEYRGQDVGGIAVHAAARIMDAAGPDEILVSRTVRDLVAGGGVPLTDRGAHALRGLGEDWPLYAVATTG
jgi:class 3 adenylate cyclase